MEVPIKCWMVPILLALAITLVGSQWARALAGQRCRLFEDPFRPDLVCDNAKGLQCQNVGAGLGGNVCTCYSPFVYDQTAQECRRSLGYTCQPSLNQTLYNRRSWFDKCLDDASCDPVDTNQRGGFGRRDGRCNCRDRDGFVPFGVECAQVRR